MPLSMEKVESVWTSERDWLLSQPGVQGGYAGLDKNGVPCLFVMGAVIPPHVKHTIEQRLGVPVEFVTIAVQTL